MYPNVDPKKAVGSKVVGPMLRPELELEKAQTWLLDCLSDTRSHKLSHDQVIFILRKAKEIGYHEGMAYFCGDVGYSMPTPIEPKDESADLMRQIQDSQKHIAAQMARLIALQPV